jgi:3-dehydroquinate synthase
MRGIDYIQVPTTLLSQVDSAVGGKTGINTVQGKNLVGSFYQPKAVLCDTNTLGTLPERELKSGYAEIVKYGLINDLTFFDWLEAHGAEILNLEEDSLSYVIETSCRAKAHIVAEDERESGKRALLNLGHTFGHALEVSAGYDGRLLHGEAVSIGMVMAFDLSVRMGLCPQEDLSRVENHLNTCGLITQAGRIIPPLNHDASELLEFMKRDKKAQGDKIGFILTHGIGQAFQTSEVDFSDVVSVLSHSLEGV